MTNILLTRIDNRLVHGQVGVTWVSSLGANLLVVVDDKVAEDPLQQELMGVTADRSGVGLRFFSLEKAIATIHKASPQQKLFLVCPTPKVVRQLVEGGVPIQSVNVGNMHFSEGKRQLDTKVFVNDEDMDDLYYLCDKGIEVFAQDVPSSKKGVYYKT